MVLTNTEGQGEPAERAGLSRLCLRGCLCKTGMRALSRSVHLGQWLPCGLLLGHQKPAFSLFPGFSALSWLSAPSLHREMGSPG